MSTTFGVKIEDEIIPIARRVGGTNGATMWFTNPLGNILDDDIEVIAIDNTNQGVNTIKDIKNIIKEVDN